jgi:gamma-glutamyltranspeptidase/glutathione hydrolase
MQPSGTSSIAAQSLIDEARLKEVRAGNLPGGPVVAENPSAATFVAFDRDGSAAACAVTLNSLFGVGRVAPGTGIVLAAASGQGGRGATALGPMLIVNENIGDFYFGGAAAGGVAAPGALIAVAARTMLNDQPLPEALAAKRVIGTADAGLVLYEDGIEETVLGRLRELGTRLNSTASLGRVNAGVCSTSLDHRSKTCIIGSDPRGHGLAIGAR